MLKWSNPFSISSRVSGSIIHNGTYNCINIIYFYFHVIDWILIFLTVQLYFLKIFYIFLIFNIDNGTDFQSKILFAITAPFNPLQFAILSKIYRRIKCFYSSFLLSIAQWGVQGTLYQSYKLVSWKFILNITNYHLENKSLVFPEE